MDPSLTPMLRSESVDNFMDQDENRREIYGPDSNTILIFTLNYWMNRYSAHNKT